MAKHGKRLEQFRAALPCPRPGAFPTAPLSVAAGLTKSRWWELEQRETWKPEMQAQADLCVTETLRRLNAPENQAAAWVAYIKRESHELPALDAEWINCPPMAPIGRPVGSRKGPDGRMVIPGLGSAPISAPTTFIDVDSVRVTLRGLIEQAKAGLPTEAVVRAAIQAFLGAATAAGIAVAVGPHFWDQMGRGF